MVRASISEDVQTEVLLRSRRRCCICFGLDRDTSMKSGQIAHIDRDHANGRADNLVFLCLEHHDAYDSRPSQRKGFTHGEIKAFRSELSHALGSAFAQQVHFGVLTLPPADPVAGHYIRLGTGSDSAEMEFTPLPDGMDGTPRYFVSGFAYFGTDREHGPNMGECAFVLQVDEGSGSAFYGDGEHTIRAHFAEDNLIVDEVGHFGRYGMGVTFDGVYQRVRPATDLA
jgi:hypothetical protein